MATREGEDTPKLDQGGRGDIKATREEEDTSDQDQVDQENTEATREGEDNPKLDQETRGDIKVTRYKRPVTTKEEEEKYQAKTNDGQEKNTKEEEKYQTHQVESKDHDTKGNDGSRSYLLVDPRPGEAPDYDNSTSVQCTGTGRSTVHNRDVMVDTLHSQHLKAEGATRGITGARGAGLSGVKKGSAAEGSTRSITEA